MKNRILLTSSISRFHTILKSLSSARRSLQQLEMIMRLLVSMLTLALFLLLPSNSRSITNGIHTLITPSSLNCWKAASLSIVLITSPRPQSGPFLVLQNKDLIPMKPDSIERARTLIQKLLARLPLLSNKLGAGYSSILFFLLFY